VTDKNGGTEALEVFCRQPDKFGLVITDLTMPGMKGTELSREIIKNRPDIPIILCTGYYEVISPEMRQELGIREVLFKPVSDNVLTESIRRVFDQKE